MLAQESFETIQHMNLSPKTPVLSLYLDVNPSRPENARRAFLLKAKDAIRDSGVPKSFAAKLLERLSLEHFTKLGRTLAVFCSEDMRTLYKTFYLKEALPVLEQSGGVLAHWGKPYTTPLLLALEDQVRYAVVLVDQAHWRYFEVYFGEIEELQDAIRPIDPNMWRRYTESKTATPAGVPARGGMGKDKFVRRVAEQSMKFFRETAKLLEQAIQKSRTDHIILLGVPEQLSAYETALSANVASKVVDRLSPPANPRAPAQDILPLVKETMARVAEEEQLAVLNDISEKGVRGFEVTLDALNEGRLMLMALPWTEDKTVYYCETSGRIAATAHLAERLCPHEEHSLKLLKEVLPEVAQKYSLKLAFMRGDAEQKLQKDYGGLGGLTRW